MGSVYMYDPQTDEWIETRWDMDARQYHASAVVGGKLYVFGGSSDEGRLSMVEVYGPYGPSLDSDEDEDSDVDSDVDSGEGRAWTRGALMAVAL